MCTLYMHTYILMYIYGCLYVELLAPCSIELKLDHANTNPTSKSSNKEY